jgi:hypothetical protein
LQSRHPAQSGKGELIMKSRTLEQAMRIAAGVRYFRQCDMQDARSVRELGGSHLHVGEYVADARSWNRQLMAMQRIIRRSLFERYQAGVSRWLTTTTERRGNES